jgi:hypothetical protein
MNARIGKNHTGKKWEIRVNSNHYVTAGWDSNGSAIISAEDSWHLVQFAENLLKAAQAIQGYEWVNDEIKEN